MERCIVQESRMSLAQTRVEHDLWVPLQAYGLSTYNLHDVRIGKLRECVSRIVKTRVRMPSWGIGRVLA